MPLASLDALELDDADADADAVALELELELELDAADADELDSLSLLPSDLPAFFSESASPL